MNPMTAVPAIFVGAALAAVERRQPCAAPIAAKAAPTKTPDPALTVRPD